MKRLGVLAPLLLAACSGASQAPSSAFSAPSSASSAPPSTAVASPTTTDLAAQALAAKNPALAAAAPLVANAVNSLEQSLIQSGSSSQQFEYRDVWVQLGDADGMRQLAQYFMRMDIWMLDKFENMTPTFRHYRFRRIVGQDGKPLPEVDLFNPPKPQQQP